MRTYLTILLATALLCVGCVSAPDFSGVVAVRARMGVGSGVVVGHDSDGYIIATAAHVVRTDRYPLVDQYIGEVVALDADADVAVVRIEDRGQGYRVRRLAPAVQGEPVTALGWTFSGNSCTILAYFGHITTIHWLMPPRTLAANCGAFPGMSGGPVIDRWGNCIGLVRGCPTAGFIMLDSTTIIAPARVILRLMERV